jgi:hypothetical protein
VVAPNHCGMQVGVGVSVHSCGMQQRPGLHQCQWGLVPGKCYSPTRSTTSHCFARECHQFRMAPLACMPGACCSPCQHSGAFPSMLSPHWRDWLAPTGCDRRKRRPGRRRRRSGGPRRRRLLAWRCAAVLGAAVMCCLAPAAREGEGYSRGR